jgi:NIPSNAP
MVRSAAVFYELHISEIAPGRRRAAHALFTDSLLGYFYKHGIRPMLFCEPEFGAPIGQIVYLIPWDSLAAYEQAWASLRADPEWSEAQELANQNGRIFARTTKTLFRDVPAIMTRLAELTGAPQA